jgi:hypothetical protein
MEEESKGRSQETEIGRVLKGSPELRIPRRIWVFPRMPVRTVHGTSPREVWAPTEENQVQQT